MEEIKYVITGEIIKPGPDKNNDDFYEWIKEQIGKDVVPYDAFAEHAGQACVGTCLRPCNCELPGGVEVLVKAEVIDNKVNWHTACAACEKAWVYENVTTISIKHE
jgi:hypothetical protein